MPQRLQLLTIAECNYQERTLSSSCSRLVLGRLLLMNITIFTAHSFARSMRRSSASNLAVLNYLNRRVCEMTVRDDERRG